MISEINRKRLEWMAKAKRGEHFPKGLFNDDNWAKNMAELATEVLAELEKHERS